VNAQPTIEQELVTYLKMSGKRSTAVHLKSYRTMATNLAREGKDILHLTRRDLDSYHKQDHAFLSVKDFFIKSGRVILDTRSGHNNHSAEHLTSHLAAYLAEERRLGRRERSIDDMRIGVEYFERYLTLQNESRLLCDITADTIERYQFDLMHSGVNPITGKRWKRNTAIKTLMLIHQYFRFLVRQEVITYNPCALLALPRKDETPSPLPLAYADIGAFLGSFAGTKAHAIRDRILYELTYCAGLRMSEVLALTKDDVNLTDGLLLVREGKGGTGRAVPLCSSLVTLLKPYLAIRNRENVISGEDNASLFPGQKQQGRKTLCAVVVAKTYRNQVRAVCGKKSNFHVLRHSIAKHLLESGLDIRYVQRFLGHKSINSTAVYTQVSPEDMRKSIAAFHPRELHKQDYLGYAKFTHSTSRSMR
jgi:site-specific recombinase XerD